MTTRPALRTALVGVFAVLLGFVVIAGWLGTAAHQLHQEKQRATAVVAGVVIQDDLDEGDIRVRWRDASGSTHEQQFGIYDTDRYHRGVRFDVRYNPQHPGRGAFAADPMETDAEDHLEVPLAFGGVLTICVLAGWAWRGLRYRRVARRPASRAFGQALSGESLRGAFVNTRASCWLALRDGPQEPVVAWQRVMWHPALALANESVVVQVHGRRRRLRAVVIDLPDGTALVPIGRRAAQTAARV